MTGYRYFTFDLGHNNPDDGYPLILGEWQFTNVTWGEELKTPGPFHAELLLSDYRVKNAGSTSVAVRALLGDAGAGIPDNPNAVDYCTQPGRCGYIVERNGVIVTAGIIWSRTWQSDTQVLALDGTDLISYADHRNITNDLVFDTGTAPVDMVGGSTGITSQLASGLSNAGSWANAWTGETNPDWTGIPQPGVLAPTAFLGVEKRNIRQTIDTFASQDYPFGYDYYVDYDQASWSESGWLSATVHAVYPYAGRAYRPGQSPVLEFPGPIVKYKYPEDGSSLANTIHGFGPSNTAGQFEYTGVASSSLTAGFPLLEDVVTYNNAPDPNQVAALTTSLARARAVPVVVLEADWVVSTSGRTIGPSLGDFHLGDIFQIRIVDDRFPAGFTTYLRLSKYDVKVGDDGNAEIVTGSFVAPTY